MAGASRQRLSDDVERELIALYTSSDMRPPAIADKFGLKESRLYHVLKKHGIATRQLTSHRRARRELPSIGASAELIDARNGESEPLQVTTDKEGFVQSAARIPTHDKLYVWEVRFDSAMRVEAYSITDAINQVVRMPNVRRVFGAVLKSAP